MAYKRNYIRYSRGVNGYKVEGIPDIFHSRAAAEEACQAKYGELTKAVNGTATIVTISVPAEVRAEVSKASTRFGIPVSQLYWKAVLDYIANLEAEQTPNSFNLDELLRTSKEGQ